MAVGLRYSCFSAIGAGDFHAIFFLARKNKSQIEPTTTCVFRELVTQNLHFYKVWKISMFTLYAALVVCVALWDAYAPRLHAAHLLAGQKPLRMRRMFCQMFLTSTKVHGNIYREFPGESKDFINVRPLSMKKAIISTLNLTYRSTAVQTS